MNDLVLVIATSLHLLVLDCESSLNVGKVSSCLLELITENPCLVLRLPALIRSIDEFPSKLSVLASRLVKCRFSLAQVLPDLAQSLLISGLYTRHLFLACAFGALHEASELLFKHAHLGPELVLFVSKLLSQGGGCVRLNFVVLSE